MTAVATGAEFGPSDVPEKWVAIDTAAPALAATMLAYLAQIAVSMRPNTVNSAETDLRIFAGFLIEHDPALGCAGDIERSHVEAFKIWQRAQPGRNGKPFKEASFRRRMSLLKMFFIRITEWEWDDAPPRVPIFFGDVPQRDESLPKFLDDGDYTKFMRALADEPTVFRRLAVEMLALTGMRVGELCELEHDAVNIMGNEPWLRIPVGKLHNDRFIPLHPQLVELIAQYQASDGPFIPGRLLSGAQGRPTATPLTAGSNPSAAGPESATFTPTNSATPSPPKLNRGMSIEAIAALLGHRSLDMTMRYAKISNKVVADEYAAVAAKIEALYNTGQPISADAIGPSMKRLQHEVHHRLLGNGWCQRPAQLDCSFESICESCTYCREASGSRTLSTRSITLQTTASTACSGSPSYLVNDGTPEREALILAADSTGLRTVCVSGCSHTVRGLRSWSGRIICNEE